MNSNQENQSRRERIMNSAKDLPGDLDRAKAEENEDFDAGDTGNFGTRQAAQRSPADLDRRAVINQSDGQLEGDLERGDDDQRIDEQGANSTATQGTRDSIVTEGDASGGGTPIGGGSQSVFSSGIDRNITGGSDETATASRAFGGSTTGYGQTEAQGRGNIGTTMAGGSAGGLATGTVAGSAGSSGGQTSGGPSNAGGTETGMVAGGGIEGAVSLVDPDDVMLAKPDPSRTPDDDEQEPNVAGRTSIPDNAGGVIDQREEKTIHMGRQTRRDE